MEVAAKESGVYFTDSPLRKKSNLWSRIKPNKACAARRGMVLGSMLSCGRKVLHRMNVSDT